MKEIRSNYRQHQVFYSGNRVIEKISTECFKDNLIYFNPAFYFRYNLHVDTNEVLGISSWSE